MEQDDLEDEIFTKTIVAHLDIFSTFSRNLMEWQTAYIQTEMLYAIAVVLGLLLCIFGTKKGFMLSNLISGHPMLISEDSCEQKSADAAVFAIKGRRQTMEDRFALVQIPTPHMPEDPIVRLFCILDGHGGHYAAVYVKKHLIESLVAKIKVLKLLTQKSRLSRQAVVKTAERLCPGSVTKTMLDHIGMPLSEYKQVNPESILFRSESSNCHNGSGTKTINGSLVLSSRIKPLEEVPIPKVCTADHDEGGKAHEGHAHNDMLSPYSNVPKKSHSKSPRRQASKDTPKEITDYINNKGEIQFPELLCDEVAKVDESLLKAAKKDGQVGGSTLLVAILDGATLWVANVGDSRGVLRNARGEVIPLSFDHKPCQLKEKKRIEEAGGYVSLNGVWRVQGVLATSRAMGDYPLKDKRVVICEPDILSFNLDKNPPDFAVLASDGLWDTHSNEEAVGHIAKCFSNSDSVLGAAKSLTRDAYNKGSTDNVSVMILNLKNMV